jgi:hypothetical protein
METSMAEKRARYWKLLESLAALGDMHAQKITSNRYKLMYHYFVRCVSLTSGIILLVEAEDLTGAYALEKSLVDALLGGLYFGYVAPDKEVEDTIAMALKGRGTGHSNMRRRARMIDQELSRRRTFMTGMFNDAVKKSSELLNEFGHGGLLSTALAMKRPLPPVRARGAGRERNQRDRFPGQRVRAGKSRPGTPGGRDEGISSDKPGAWTRLGRRNKTNGQ